MRSRFWMDRKPESLARGLPVGRGMGVSPLQVRPTKDQNQKIKNRLGILDFSDSLQARSPLWGKAKGLYTAA